MTIETPTADRIHPAALMYSEEVRAGKLSRREFLTRASALGVSAAAAYGLLGLAAPQALAQDTPVVGGTLRMDMETKGLKDPRAGRLVADLQLLPRLAGIPGRVQCRRHLPWHAAGKLDRQ